jgi:hypothetical protein
VGFLALVLLALGCNRGADDASFDGWPDVEEGHLTVEVLGDGSLPLVGAAVRIDMTVPSGGTLTWNGVTDENGRYFAWSALPEPVPDWLPVQITVTAPSESPLAASVRADSMFHRPPPALARVVQIQLY